MSGPFLCPSNPGKVSTITPSGEVEVRNGADQTFTIRADQGYSLLEVAVDGTSVGTPSSYTFSNVTEDHDIKVSFSSGGGCQMAGSPLANLWLFLPLVLLRGRKR